MQVKQKIILVTGANRGIGAAIVRELLKQDVAKIYAAARNAKSLPDFGDKRVVPLTLDITNRAQVAEAASKAKDTQVLINNAGVANTTNILSGTPDGKDENMSVNYFGTVQMMHAFAPVLQKNGGGVIANVISIVGMAAMAMIGNYSASKAALLSATQSARAELASSGVKVAGIFPGPIDTDMSKDFPFDKASAESTAELIVKGIAAGQEEIYPDPMSQQMSQLWLTNYKELEKQFFAMAQPAKAA